MNIYEIDQGIQSCVDMETGEIIDIERLNALQIERDKKIENVALWIENLEAEQQALKEQEEKFAYRKKQAEKKIESLKGFLGVVLDGTKFETTMAKITFLKSKSVSITEESKIPQEYIKETVKTDIDKAKIKKDLLSGKEIEGAVIVEKLNPQINKTRRTSDNGEV